MNIFIIFIINIITAFKIHHFFINHNYNTIILSIFFILDHIIKFIIFYHFKINLNSNINSFMFIFSNYPY